MALLTEDQQDTIDQMMHIWARAERFFNPVTSTVGKVQRDKRVERDQFETDGRPDDASIVPGTYPILEAEATRRSLTVAELADKVQVKRIKARRVRKDLNAIYEDYRQRVKTAVPPEDNPQFNTWLIAFEAEVQALVDLEA